MYSGVQGIMTHTTHTYSIVILCLTLIIAACTPKNTAMQQTAYDTLRQAEKCINGDQQACKHIKALVDRYNKDHPCTYIRSREFEDKINLVQIIQNDIASLDALILEAKANNYGDCQTRSSMATLLRFAKGFGLYLAKDFPASAREFKIAMAELGPDNNLDTKMAPLTLSFYPAALIKSGNTEQAKEIMLTPIFTPIKDQAGDNMALILPFLRHGGELLQIPEPQNYSWPILLLSGITKDILDRHALPPTLPAFLDALKTLAPYTPVPECILEYKQ
jgi:hypothetical protein